VNRARPTNCVARTRTALRRLAVLAAAACVVLAGVGPHPVVAAAPPEVLALEDGGRFEVRTATLEPVDGVLHLSATLDLSLSRSALRALRDGVPVRLELDVAVNRKRSYLPDDDVANLVQRWQLQYHALSERYLVANLNTGQQTSYSALAPALASLAQVRALPVLDEALMEEGERYEASVRAIASVDGGLPDAVRVMMFWADWKRTTDWYTWTVRT
jgi:anti-sigma-K factor RskA